MIFGVDVGISGAIAALDVNGQVHVIDMPVTTSRSKKIVDCLKVQKFILTHMNSENKTVFIENVWGMNGDGVTNAFRFGFHCGMVEAVFHTLGFKVIHLAPAVWKANLGLGPKKAESLNMARDLFPYQVDKFKLQKHHDRAEASLIAFVGKEYFK